MIEEDLEIKEVIASKCVKEYKTGYWKAQLNLLESGKYMVELYWFNYYLESSKEENWYETYNNKLNAEESYKKINLKLLS